jgi:integrase
MVDSLKKPKISIKKFPLTLHPTGQYCKKVRGRIYYFGTDKHEALRQFLEQAAYLYAGKSRKPNLAIDHLAIKTLCNLYLEHQEAKVLSGEITMRYLVDQIKLLKVFVRFIGPNRRSSDVVTIDLQNYRAKLIKSGKAPATMNNHISAIKVMYHWAIDNEIISTAPNLKALKKAPIHKVFRATFTKDQVAKLLNLANDQMQAMIWLGLNCGFGCTDCAELQWSHLDLNKARVHFPRGKTGVDRNLPLWPETIQALKSLHRNGIHVFSTCQGNQWVRVIQHDNHGVQKNTIDNALSKEFSKLLKKTGIEKQKGLGFYSLRRTAATWAAQSGDPFAVQRLLGHADLKMASTYVQDINEQTDRVINNSRRFIAQDDS